MRHIPTRTLNKVKAASIAAPLSILVLFAVRRFLIPDLPDTEATALMALVTCGATYAAGWLTRISPGEIRAVEDARHGTGV